MNLQNIDKPNLISGLKYIGRLGWIPLGPMNDRQHLIEC